ncbi:FAD-dependent monooxygenase [Nocardia sp. NBC_01327]|uniref:FAD-dependent monooxygenase n=1 Tax=Nocardia sp. NBC_01327 TaxID=2903593 RepID=UPI002E10E87A|nr:FAD-dependent monooxygenase [Nocardia sp. NBC_01327]
MYTPVLVVGGGPVGLTLSILLSRYEIEHLVVEARLEPSPHPKARGLAARSMEIFRRCGLEDDVRAAGLPADQVAFFRGRTLVDPDFVRTGPVSDGQPEHTPSPGLICSQDVLERVLTARAGERVRRGVRLVSYQQKADAVVGTLLDTRNGEETVVQADWLIGCDGVRSTVRAGANIDMAGPTGLGEFLSVRFEADLGAVVADRASASYFLPAGGFMAVDNDRHWIFQYPLTGGVDSADLDLVALIRAGVGLDDLGVEIHDAVSWRMDAQLAAAYRSDRVLLAGDAAHAIPPTGGHGLNVGIGDADNLAWKLAAVHTAAADPVLLDTYESERRPVARQVIDIATANARTEYRIDDLLLLTTDYGDPAAPLNLTGYHPSASIGARLPHAWLPDGRSTLDLVGFGPTHLSGNQLPEQLRRECGLPETTSLSVRPDGHIAARRE